MMIQEVIQATIYVKILNWGSLLNWLCTLTVNVFTNWI
jgi:hypothetical protein